MIDERNEEAISELSLESVAGIGRLALPPLHGVIDSVVPSFDVLFLFPPEHWEPSSLRKEKSGLESHKKGESLDRTRV